MTIWTLTQLRYWQPIPEHDKSRREHGAPSSGQCDRNSILLEFQLWADISNSILDTVCFPSFRQRIIFYAKTVNPVQWFQGPSSQWNIPLHEHSAASMYQAKSPWKYSKAAKQQACITSHHRWKTKTQQKATYSLIMQSVSEVDCFFSPLLFVAHCFSQKQCHCSAINYSTGVALHTKDSYRNTSTLNST